MAEPLWTGEAILQATDGAVFGAAADVSGVSIDTRTIERGDLFVALAGVRDGHEFVAQAFEKGAACAIVSKVTEGAGPQVVVSDALRALERLGEAARFRAAGAKRAAITGSVGKTSVTQAVFAGLRAAGRAHGSVKSYNNHIGVPLTLARMPADTERAVFEIGMNHAGEIEPLSRMVRPHVALVTTVGPVHVEAFADGEAGVARAKAEIFAGLEPGGTAILPLDNRWFEVLAEAALAAGARRVLSFGEAETADARLTGFRLAPGGARLQARVHGRHVEFPIRQSGAHWGPNSLAVLLMLEALDVPLDTALEALGSFEPLSGRGAEQRVRIDGGEILLIDESYNANPVSMRAALRSLGARQTTGRRIAAVAEMYELGDESPRYHAAVAEDVEAAGVDLVFCAGPLMRNLWDALPEARRGAWAVDTAALAPKVVEAVRPGDAVMVKGSNSAKASAIADALKALGAERRERA